MEAARVSTDRDESALCRGPRSDNRRHYPPLLIPSREKKGSKKPIVWVLSCVQFVLNSAKSEFTKPLPIYSSPPSQWRIYRPTPHLNSPRIRPLQPAGQRASSPTMPVNQAAQRPVNRHRRYQNRCYRLHSPRPQPPGAH